MLLLSTRKSHPYRRAALILAVLLVFASGGYVLILTNAPSFALRFVTKPIEVKTLPKPSANDNRIVIPKIGINIPYASGVDSREHGAEWRYSERGNPETGGNFIVTAYRFNIQTTPLATIEKSPFYNIDKLIVHDKLVVDYNGVRYGYAVEKTSGTTQVLSEVEAVSKEPKLTLYSREPDGSDTDRIIIVAKPLGKVDLTQ